MSSYPEIRTGFWRNELTDALVLTLRERAAGVLSAFLVLFVGFVATSAWNAVRFMLHQVQLRSRNRDGFHQQLQATLRNTGTHAQASWLAATLILRWSRRIGLVPALRRGLPVVGIALASFLAWSAAQLFVSLIWSSAGNQYLIKNSFCGTFFPGVDTLSLADKVQLAAASTYVEQCHYQRYDAPECGTLPVPAINWTVEDVPCPFLDPESCTRTNSTPMRIDTGLINSNTHFGVNARFEDTVDYRRVATCSPIYNKGFVETYGPFFVYHMKYGWSVHNNYNSTYNFTEIPFPHIYNYGLYALSHDPANETVMEWKPNATLFDRPDAEASIFFLLTNLVYSYHHIYDPLFGNDYIADQGGKPAYTHFSAFKTLMCVEEQELCNPNTHRCVKFTRSTNLHDFIPDLELSEAQRQTAVRIVLFVTTYHLSYVASRLPTQLLASMTVLLRRQEMYLPKDQWRKEVSRWFSIVLHLLQTEFIEYVSGPSDPARLPFYNSVLGEIDDCKKQRISNAPGFRNFDAVALITVLVAGGVIILFGLSVDTVVGYVQKKLRRGEHLRLGWLLDGVFQQQRLAFEAAGVGPWVDVDKVVPMTDEKHFPSVDLQDPLYPTLYKRDGHPGVAIVSPEGDQK
ncbi:Cytochrome P450 [Fusarium albosuccineum]|uniref:Cytochrome P450 n=1 Tax=Fusarium albosuccineum TaxID=1237068 RepID=A0A8H4P3K7_9HYPO|nr:Cytochrome P450 [Fusarium albosuccineum]